MRRRTTLTWAVTAATLEIGAVLLVLLAAGWGQR